MKTILAGMILAISAAATELPKQEYKSFYLDNNGNRMEASNAIIEAVKGDTVFKCQVIEAKISKSGTSIGIKSVRKPKVSRGE